MTDTTDASMEFGARRLPRPESSDTVELEGLKRCTTTDLADATSAAGVCDAGLRPIDPRNARFAGPAVTVAVPWGSQEARRAAMASAAAGDVLVVNAHGASLFAVLGGMLAKSLKDKGLAGVVIDGYVRDPEEIQEFGLPVFCRGFTPVAAPKIGPGEVNVPIACAGVVVMPGDIVVADLDGVVILPKDCAASVATKLRRSDGST